MRAIVLVAEIMLDNAKVFFRDGWEERANGLREIERERRGEDKKGEEGRQSEGVGNEGIEEGKEERNEGSFSPAPSIDISPSKHATPTQFVTSPAASPRSTRSPSSHQFQQNHQLTEAEITNLENLINDSLDRVLSGEYTELDPTVVSGNAPQHALEVSSPRVSTTPVKSLLSPNSKTNQAGTPPRSPIELISPPSSPRTSSTCDLVPLSLSVSGGGKGGGGKGGRPANPRYTRFGRRRMITACRALRSQINTFEEQVRHERSECQEGWSERFCSYDGNIPYECYLYDMRPALRR